MAPRVEQEPLTMFEDRDVEFNFAYHVKNHKYNRENDSAFRMLIFMGYASFFRYRCYFCKPFYTPVQ